MDEHLAKEDTIKFFFYFVKFNANLNLFQFDDHASCAKTILLNLEQMK